MLVTAVEVCRRRGWFKTCVRLNIHAHYRKLPLSKLEFWHTVLSKRYFLNLLNDFANSLHRSLAAPAWYHGGRKGYYNGDRHPEEYYLEENPEAFEGSHRKCGNCGEVKLCLREEWLRGR